VPYGILYLSGDNVMKYLDYAGSLGLQCRITLNSIVWYTGGSLVDYFPTFAKSISATNNPSFISGMVSLVAQSSGLWGYYVGDEVYPQYHDQINSTATTLQNLDPWHPRLFVATINAGVNELPQTVQPFLDVCNIMAGDFYPYGYATSAGIAQFGATCQQFQSVCTQAVVQSGFVLQAFSFTSYGQVTCQPRPQCAAFPTHDQMKQQHDIALANATPEVILWYSYFDILRSSTDPNVVAQNWANVVAAANGN
jgi:hypothetical protein